MLEEEYEIAERDARDLGGCGQAFVFCGAGALVFWLGLAGGTPLRPVVKPSASPSYPPLLQRNRDMSEVIQADRDAAADLWSAVFPGRQGEADCMRRGIGDDGPVVAALAKHRLAHLTPNTDLSDGLANADAYEVANQLGSYVGPDTDDDLARFLLAQSKAAAAMGAEIERLRALRTQRDAVIEEAAKIADFHDTLPHLPGACGAAIRNLKSETLP